jgi:bifunctional DNA primase/polymerase-like protein
VEPLMHVSAKTETKQLAPDDPWAPGVRASDVPIVRPAASPAMAPLPDNVMTSARTALARALRLAGLGLPVFPCAATKRPTCPHSFKEATRRAGDVRRLWRDYPGPLIGVPTGSATGIFVLDVDSAKHPTAADWLERHAAHLPETRSHRTQSGGIHLLFKHRGGLRNTQAKLALGIDTRADGGYVLWWPAAIEHGHHLAPLAEIPDWLVEALTPPKPEIRPAGQRPKTPDAAKAKIEGIVGAVAAAREGERNSLAYWGACRLAELEKQAVITNGDAIALAIEAARQAGLSPKEAQRTVASAFRGQQ